MNETSGVRVMVVKHLVPGDVVLEACDAPGKCLRPGDIHAPGRMHEYSVLSTRPRWLGSWNLIEAQVRDENGDEHVWSAEGLKPVDVLTLTTTPCPVMRPRPRPKHWSEVEVDPATVLWHAEVTISELEARGAAGEDVSGPLGWHYGLAVRMRAWIGEA